MSPTTMRRHTCGHWYEHDARVLAALEASWGPRQQHIPCPNCLVAPQRAKAKTSQAKEKRR